MKKILNDLVNIFRNKTEHRKTDFKKNRRLYRFGIIAFCCLAFGISFLFSQGILYAAQVTLAWDASSGAVGYKIYYGTASHNYSSVIDVGNVRTYTFTNLVDGRTYYFAATAYDSSNYESDYSSEVSYNSTTTTTPTSYTITASAGTGGTISPSGSVSVTSGASRTFTITPNSGYTISNVIVNGSSVGAVSSYTFSNVTANRTIAATFAATTTTPTSYTITASAGTGGTISPSGSVSVTSGASRTFTITPNSGYTISNVTVNGSSVGAVSSYTFSNVTANRTIAATFAATSQTQTYTLSTTTTGTGTGTITRNPTGYNLQCRDSRDSYSHSKRELYVYRMDRGMFGNKYNLPGHDELKHQCKRCIYAQIFPNFR